MVFYVGLKNGILAKDQQEKKNTFERLMEFAYLDKIIMGKIFEERLQEIFEKIPRPYTQVHRE